MAIGDDIKQVHFAGANINPRISIHFMNYTHQIIDFDSFPIHWARDEQEFLLLFSFHIFLVSLSFLLIISNVA